MFNERPEELKDLLARLVRCEQRIEKLEESRLDDAIGLGRGAIELDDVLHRLRQRIEKLEQERTDEAKQPMSDAAAAEYLRSCGFVPRDTCDWDRDG